MMPRLLYGLQRRLRPAYLFLVVSSAAGLAIAGALDLGWGLELADLRQRALIQPGLLGR
jgi:hypothetical protein